MVPYLEYTVESHLDDYLDVEEEVGEEIEGVGEEFES
jgi:hypothetical protein